MHQFACAEDGVYRTGLNTKRAAYTFRFCDIRKLAWFVLAVAGV